MSELPPGCRMVDGKRYLINAEGGLIPEEVVKPIDKLQDEVVRKIMGFALPLSAQVARFRQHCFDDVDEFVALLEQEYGAKRGGSKGNLTFTTFDGLFKVVVQVSDHVVFGPELQVAKGIIDECLREWSEGSRVEIRAIIDRAFNVDNQGHINRNDLMSLLRLDITDARWQKAMQAIRDSFKIIGSKRYIRFYQRSGPDAPWRSISIDVAAG